jgi:type III secretory pathway component EscU
MWKNYDEEEEREVKVVRGGVVIKKERREVEKELWGGSVEQKRKEYEGSERRNYEEELRE